MEFGVRVQFLDKDKVPRTSCWIGGFLEQWLKVWALAQMAYFHLLVLPLVLVLNKLVNLSVLQFPPL